MRARGFCARDAYPDVLKGIHSAEEQSDIPRTIGSGTTAKAPEPAPVEKRVEVEPMDEATGIKHYASIMEMAPDIGSLKNTFTEAHRWYKSIQSHKAKDVLKSFYDQCKTDLEAPEPAPIEQPGEPAEQSDADWMSELKEADNA